MQGVTVSQGTTQPGTGDAALLPPIQEGFWIWKGEHRARSFRVVSAEAQPLLSYV